MQLNRRPFSFEILEDRRVLTTVAVTIPTDLMGQPGGQVVAPVNIDNAEGIRGAEIHISYDSTVLHTTVADVTSGSLWPSDVQVVANVDDAMGSIVVFVSSAEELPASSGSLLNVHFSIGNNAPAGATTAINLTEVVLNEGAITPVTSNGLVTITSQVGTASISGTIYADTNNNNQPDAFEGIPHVKIVLTNTDNNQQFATFTDDNGHYQFDNLSAGSYHIQEQQPSAFIEGGVNDISLSLTNSQTVTNQNFRERGLRPEYIYNRLFTTTVQPVGSTNWVSAVSQIVTDSGNAAATHTVVQSSAKVAQATSKVIKAPDASLNMSSTALKQAVTSQMSPTVSSQSSSQQVRMASGSASSPSATADAVSQADSANTVAQNGTFPLVAFTTPTENLSEPDINVASVSGSNDDTTSDLVLADPPTLALAKSGSDSTDNEVDEGDSNPADANLDLDQSAATDLVLANSEDWLLI